MSITSNFAHIPPHSLKPSEEVDESLNLEKLPPEILERIFSELNIPLKLKVQTVDNYNLPASARTETVKKIHQQLTLVSKAIQFNVISTENHWININQLNLRDLGCKTSKEAVAYIIKHQLPFANLQDFPDVDDEDLEKLGTFCPSLIAINLDSKNFTESGLAKLLGNLKHLRSISLNHCEQLVDKEDQFATALGLHPELQHLSLFNCYYFIGGDLFSENLGKLTQLKSLKLLGCTSLPDDEKFAIALGNLKNLEVLNLMYCDNFRNPKITDALGNLVKLKNLKIGQGIYADADQLIHELKKLVFIENLNLTLFNLITIDHLIEIGKAHPQLQTLSLSAWRHVDSDQLIEALKSFPSLKSLDLSYCHQIPGDKFIELARLCPKLETLKINGCQIAEEQLVEILANLPNLRYLEARKVISNEKAEELAAQCPQLKIITFG